MGRGYPSDAEYRHTIPVSNSPLSHAHHNLQPIFNAEHARSGMQQAPQQPSLRTTPPLEVNATLIQEILTKLEMVLEQQTLILRLIQPSQQNAAEYAMEDGLLPLMDQQGLQRLETDLLEAEFKVKLINHLSLIGGCNLKDAVWR
ncbi:hypothetical protein UPYG_G00110700 [Umbra pygmaea]|uniref:Uncharacterized protein n=1 Tax=Umbra pygmaea TaxID=75934 RepID=A0ABD0X2U7_UMBPY